MTDTLIQDIDNYIEYLNQCGYQITVHGRTVSGITQHNIHTNPFCAYVKTDEIAWSKCVECQAKVLKEYEKGQIFGMCHFGLEEYVFFVDDMTFVSVSGYGINKDKAMERISRFADGSTLKLNELKSIWEKNLNHSEEDINKLAIKIKPLCYMLNLLQTERDGVPWISTKNTLFDSVISYIQRNFMSPITIKDIAKACACSESTVSHIFKNNFGKTVNEYITELRINQAKRLLKATDIPISRISLMCGFTNINYFPTAFKKHIGISPTEYRIKKTKLTNR